MAEKKVEMGDLFPGEDPSLLPLTFHFGEPVNYEEEALEMATPFQGEESITRPGGGYDTGV